MKKAMFYLCTILLLSSPSYSFASSATQQPSLQFFDVFKTIPTPFGIPFTFLGESYEEKLRVEQSPVNGKIIVIDPGHGGRFAGAQVNGIAEEDLNLDIALKVRELLEKYGAIVYMTRETDIECNPSSYKNDLACRPALANEKKAHLFLSIHANSFSNSSVSGVETFYNNQNSKVLSSILLDEISAAADLKKRFSKLGTFMVLKKSHVPSVLIETAYLTSHKDSSRLKNDTFRIDIATGIFNGVQRYFH